MKKSIRKFDLSLDRLLDLADRCNEAEDYLGALRWINKADRLYGIREDYDFVELRADIYEAGGVLDAAIEYWFYALDCAGESELTEVYESLAWCFEKQGEKAASAYYYEKMLRRMGWEKEDIDSYLEQPEPEEPPRFTWVYPPEKADYGKVIGQGLDAMRRGEYETAEEYFSEVPVGSGDYARALNFSAIGKLMQGKPEEAIEPLEAQYRRTPRDVELTVTLAMLRRANGDGAGAEALARELIAREDLSEDEMFKVAALCCELELHEEAYLYCEQVDFLFPFDGNLLYMEAVSACKSGRLSRGLELLDRILLIYPDADVVRYYRDALAADETAEISYLYRVPEAERKRREQVLQELLALELGELECAYRERYAELDDLFFWCFDELDGQDIRLQAFAITLALHARADGFLQDILLNYQVDDVIKVEIVRGLCMRNETCSVRLVVYRIYQELSLPHIRVGKKARKKFLEGYALCVSQFGLRADGLIRILPAAAERLYRALEAGDAFALAKSPQVIAVALCCFCGMRREKDTLRMLAMVLDADVDEVMRLLEELPYDQGTETV